MDQFAFFYSRPPLEPEPFVKYAVSFLLDDFVKGQVTKDVWV